MKKFFIALFVLMVLALPTNMLQGGGTALPTSILNMEQSIPGLYMSADSAAFRELLDPGANDDYTVGSLTPSTESYDADENIVDLVTTFQHRVVPIFVQAQCTLWDMDTDRAYIHEGSIIQRECWPLGTSFLYRSDSIGSEFITATHVIDESISPYYAELGIKITPTNYYVGLRFREVELARIDGDQAKLIGQSFGDVEAPRIASVTTIGIGTEVYSIGSTRGGSDRIYIYRFVNHGFIEGLTRGFPGGDFVANIGVISGESGSPAFVRLGDEWLYAGTIETSFFDSDKSGIVGMKPSMAVQHRTPMRNPFVQPTQPQPEPEEQTPSETMGGSDRFENWQDLSAREQAIFNRVFEANEEYKYIADFATEGVEFRTETAWIVIEVNTNFINDFFKTDFPGSGRLELWTDYISRWRVDYIENL